MAETIYAILDESGVIINRIVADKLPEGMTGVLEGETPMGIGGTYINSVYTPPPQPEIEPSVPIAVSAAQGRLALLNAGLLDQVKAAVAQADEATNIWFEYATEWRRDHPILNALGAQLGLSSEQIDDLFRLAITL